MPDEVSLKANEHVRRVITAREVVTELITEPPEFLAPFVAGPDTPSMDCEVCVGRVLTCYDDCTLRQTSW